MYTCGPTAYDYAHIGNLRSYIYADLLRRALIMNGFEVTFVMNVTDVDDKTIARSQQEHKTISELTNFYTKTFLDDLERINVPKPDKLPKATEEIEGMVELIKILLQKGFAYRTERGDYYFSIAKFKNYGKLAQVDLSNLKENAEGRLDRADEYEKDNVRDFALWKAYSAEDGDVFWETELGKGRPGWHIECSVMSAKYLGQPFDIHAGGVDLIFPHHTNEIAQSEAAYGKPLANYWMHSEHLLVDNSKMAKSKNNFYTSQDVINQGFNMLAFRYLMLSSHYRSKLNFTWESLRGAKNALNNLYTEISAYNPAKNVLMEFESAFEQAINDDLNSAKALAVVWDLIHSEHDTGDKLASLLKFDQILGLNLRSAWEEAVNLPDEIKAIKTDRDQARGKKDYTRSDALRDELEAKGYIVEDTANGTLLKKKY